MLYVVLKLKTFALTRIEDGLCISGIYGKIYLFKLHLVYCIYNNVQGLSCHALSSDIPCTATNILHGLHCH